jgi:hypothetical protein
MVGDGLLQKKPNRKPRSPVTVCIAAICQGSIIFGASDRMLTSGDGEIEFEPAFPKSFPLSTSVVAMTAGDSALQAEILQEILPIVRAQIKANPEAWLKVKDMAELYSDIYVKIKNKRAENAILGPLGLTRKTFFEGQKTMSDDFVNRITKELVNFYMADFDTILTGIDMDGPHIYVVGNNSLNCFDTVGFAAIGSGARHAQSQFMLARHGRLDKQEETILLTYSSKKYSEVAPGVGKATDMFGMGPELGSFFHIEQEMLSELEKMHKRRVRREQVALKKSVKEVHEYTKKLQEAVAKLPENQQATPSPGGTTPTDGGVSDNSKKER